jgi:hypothetical protein
VNEGRRNLARHRQADCQPPTYATAALAQQAPSVSFGPEILVQQLRTAGEYDGELTDRGGQDEKHPGDVERGLAGGLGRGQRLAGPPRAGPW